MKRPRLSTASSLRRKLDLSVYFHMLTPISVKSERGANVTGSDQDLRSAAMFGKVFLCRQQTAKVGRPTLLIFHNIRSRKLLSLSRRRLSHHGIAKPADTASRMKAPQYQLLELATLALLTWHHSAAAHQQHFCQKGLPAHQPPSGVLAEHSISSSSTSTLGISTVTSPELALLAIPCFAQRSTCTDCFIAPLGFPGLGG